MSSLAAPIVSADETIVLKVRKLDDSVIVLMPQITPVPTESPKYILVWTSVRLYFLSRHTGFLVVGEGCIDSLRHYATSKKEKGRRLFAVALIGFIEFLFAEGTEEEVFGDSGYLGVEQHDDVPKVNREGKKIAFRINVRRSSLKKLPEAEQKKAQEAEHAKSSVRSKVEHVFAVVKGMFRYRKTRLRGLAKVDAQLHMLFALANLILADRPSVTA